MIWRDCNTTSFQHRVSKWQKLFSVFVFVGFTVYLFLKSFFTIYCTLGRYICTINLLWFISGKDKFCITWSISVSVLLGLSQFLYYLVYLSFCITWSISVSVLLGLSQFLYYLVYLSFCITWSISVSVLLGLSQFPTYVRIQ